MRRVRADGSEMGAKVGLGRRAKTRRVYDNRVVHKHPRCVLEKKPPVDGRCRMVWKGQMNWGKEGSRNHQAHSGLTSRGRKKKGRVTKPEVGGGTGGA